MPVDPSVIPSDTVLGKKTDLLITTVPRYRQQPSVTQSDAHAHRMRIRQVIRISRVLSPPGSATFFRRDRSCNIFCGHSLHSANLRRAVDPSVIPSDTVLGKTMDLLITTVPRYRQQPSVTQSDAHAHRMRIRLVIRMSRVLSPPGSATFFRRDRSCNIFCGHSLHSANLRRAVDPSVIPSDTVLDKTTDLLITTVPRYRQQPSVTQSDAHAHRMRIRLVIRISRVLSPPLRSFSPFR